MDRSKRTELPLGADAAECLPILARSMRGSIARATRAASDAWRIATYLLVALAVVAGHRAMAPIEHGSWEAVTAAGLSATLLVAAGVASGLILRRRFLAGRLSRIEGDHADIVSQLRDQA
ncbi:MAG: hypothetical protein JNK11_08995 [Alphaproteobacteria bacterium]|nr:hypothetical protein [Alphaproteobacteria bacterium]